MMDAGELKQGFNVLDGAAVVAGAAVASIHIRGIIREGLSGFGWTLVWCTFTWVTLTSSGPFLFLVRRFARRAPDYPRVGDVLWTLFGLPWLLTASLRTMSPSLATRNDGLFATGLSVGLLSVSMIALTVVWSTWVMVPPEQASRVAGGSWTNRIGLILAIAWPVQCGFGLVILS
jgi:hypothetical protein